MSAEMKSQNKAHNSGFLSFFGSKLYQKNLMWWIPLLTAVFICLYSLLMCTPIGVLENVIDTPYTNHPEWGNRLMGDICVEMKPYNDMVIIVGIFAVILVLLYKFTRSNIRKNYYISNIVYSVANIVYFIFAGVSLFMVVAKYQDLYFNYQDFDAIKEASGSIDKISEIYKALSLEGLEEDFNILSGEDGLTLPIMALGGTGVISASANVDPRRMVLMVDSMLNEDYQRAQELHYEMINLIKALFVESNPVPAKTAMRIMGLPSGPLRQPLAEMKEDNVEILKKALKDSNLI